MSLLIKALNKAEEEAQAKAAKAEQAKPKKALAKSAPDVVKKKPAQKSKAKNLAASDLELSPTGAILGEAGLADVGLMRVDPVVTAEAAPPAADLTIASSPITSPVARAEKPATLPAPQPATPPLAPTKSEPASTISTPTHIPTRPTLSTQTTTHLSSKSAANVFSAKGVQTGNQNKALAVIAGLSLLALLGMGFYYYRLMNHTPELVIPPRVAQTEVAQPIQAAEPPAPTPIAQPADESASTPTTPKPLPAFVPSETLPMAEQAIVPAKKPSKKLSSHLALADNELLESETPQNSAEPIDSIEDNSTGAIKTTNKTISTKTTGSSKKYQFGDAIASDSASIHVTKSTPQASVSPTLMSAYEAYNAGKDAEAQKLYKQVLQRDVRNVDALLGLAAIATRQGRLADANGWYGKVLEIEPRNSLAQAAMLDNAPQDDTQNSESHIKNMLAKHPQDANLHVALGNLYAEQNQWPAAQQAYFDAYSLNASAENAFNLAVSLDQMGKAKLALPYYQRALAQASTNSSIDKAALEARIAAIQ